MDRWNWKAKREKKAFLALEDGTVFKGYSAGAECDSLGEVVFNTGMTGYQEILSDPSYSGQLVTMTYPEIGNTGINISDMESSKAFTNGFIIHELNVPSSFRTEESLKDFLTRHKIPAIAGIDTRALTSMLRDQGTLKGYISITRFDRSKLVGCLPEISLSFKKESPSSKAEMYLNSENVEREIRTMEVSELVSSVATISSVRRKLVEQQQRMGEGKGVVND